MTQIERTLSPDWELLSPIRTWRSMHEVLGDALQFYSFNKYLFCGHSAVMGERVEPGRTQAKFWNFFLIQCLQHEGIIAVL